MRAREKETLSRLFDQYDGNTAQLAERMTAIEESLKGVPGLGERLTALEEQGVRILAERTVRPAEVRQMHDSTRADLAGVIRSSCERVRTEVSTIKGRTGETFFLGFVVGAIAVMITLVFTGHIG